MLTKSRPSTMSVASLEADIFKSKKNLNNIVELLQLVDLSTGSLETVNEAAAALYRVFSHFLQDGTLRRVDGDAAKSAKGAVREWLNENFKLFTSHISQVFDGEDVDELQVSFLAILLRLSKAEGLDGPLLNQLYFRVCSTLLYAENLSDVCVNDFVSSYLIQYRDLRFFFYKNASKIVAGSLQEKHAKKERIAYNALRIVCAIPQPVVAGDDSSSWAPCLAQKTTDDALLKKQFQEMLIPTLQLPLTVPTFKRILAVMHKRIIPFLPKPTLLMDFLTDAYNSHHTVALLALNGLFTLISQYNLDYPLFYPKLYALLDRNILFSRSRSRFFRLLDLFLSSTHLPAALVASFIKRLSRLALSAPPGAIAIIVPFIYNLLQRHATCMQMIHKPGDLQDDPFDEAAVDPMHTGALESSLWELASLQTHFHSNIGSLASIMSQQFTKPRYELEDFFDHGYQTMCSAELKRPLKREPAFEFEAVSFDAGLEESWEF
ncbi:CBF/Mak21 family protein [Schizosaccharomyces japonicus yFS275]|uniref:CBF/Mak21 family protein n=1 Tax=Schizosaccharomyces japonicus (strain yFS275 / FY16936) TaxID=402676 RepID=B6JWR0_SCHJY|nr:CBF/Mak21 family protein [Schizosaccharomyces japonicus yFS275]EEB05811.2 CBF/Mak21 family protein [Schizosaccharomyces japonicus yFS275]